MKVQLICWYKYNVTFKVIETGETITMNEAEFKQKQKDGVYKINYEK